MDNITKSLFNLTSTNNGFFKSGKQADFLKSYTVDGSTIWGSSTSTYGNVTQQVFFLDSEGVTAVKTWSQKKQSFTRTTWERKTDKAFKTLQAAKVVAEEKKTDLRGRINAIHNRVDQLRKLADKSLPEAATRLFEVMFAKTEGKGKEETKIIANQFMINNNRIKATTEKVEKQIRRLFDKSYELERELCNVNAEFRKLYANTK